MVLAGGPIGLAGQGAVRMVDHPPRQSDPMPVLKSGKGGPHRFQSATGKREVVRVAALAGPLSWVSALLVQHHFERTLPKSDRQEAADRARADNHGPHGQT